MNLGQRIEEENQKDKVKKRGKRNISKKGGNILGLTLNLDKSHVWLGKMSCTAA